MNTTVIVNAMIALFLGLIGLYFTHSYRRRIKLMVADKRLLAYSSLWSRMVDASPVRVSKWLNQPLTLEEREKMFKEFTQWYYENGNGMLLGGNTRNLYLRVKDNLVCPIEFYEPEKIQTRLKTLSNEEQEKERGRLAIQQLSLLRSRMKADLEVYGPPYDSELNADDKELLKKCGGNLSSKVWRSST